MSDMSVDLLQLSLRFWMPAINSFTLSSKLSSIIITLFQHSGSDKGGCGEFCLPAGEPLWDWLTEGMKYDSGSPILWHDFYESWLMMGRHCMAIYTPVRAYFTTLESYHLCSNLLLQLTACKVNVRISHTYYKVLPNSVLLRDFQIHFQVQCLTVDVFMMKPGEMLATCFQSISNQIWEFCHAW